MFLALLGFLDLILGVMLIFKIGFLFLFGVIWIIKGLWSVLASVYSGFWFDFLGWLDLLAGGACIMVSFNLNFWFFLWIGVAMILKGIYSILAGIS